MKNLLVQSSSFLRMAFLATGAFKLSLFGSAGLALLFLATSPSLGLLLFSALVLLLLAPLLGRRTSGRTGKPRETRPEALPDGQWGQTQEMEAVGKLASGIAHDFNNMLTLISGYAELIDLQSEEGTPHKESAREIRKAAGHASSLIRQFLAFSRRQILQAVPLDLNALIRELEGMLRRAIGEKIQLTTFLAPGSLTIKADTTQIQQVIFNLALNARDAMPEGGCLSLETRRLGADAAGQAWIHLSVRDTGVGMNEHTRQHLFEPFFTTKAPGKGTGLGLATVKGIILQSGGSIEVESQPGKGTCFQINLPATQEAPAEDRQSSARSSPEAGTILLAEDNAPVRDLAKTILQRAGYRVLGVRSGEEALEASRRHERKIDLLIADMVMPGTMHGRALAERLLLERPGLRVLYISGNAAEPEGQEEPLLSKPFSPIELLQAVHSVLSAPQAS